MQKMISKEVHEYDGKQYAIGDPVMVHSEHVELLRHIGRAELPVKTRDLSAEDSDKYQTRDMTAGAKRGYKRKAA